MKNIFYRLFALFFRFYRILPVKENRITMLAPHPGSGHDSLSELSEYIEKKGGYEVKRIQVPSSALGFIRFFMLDSKILATSHYIFLNDNFMPMADLKFSEKTVITQLWHGEGAFKKFGLATALPDEIKSRLKKCSEKLNYIVTTSAAVSDIYAEAFGTDTGKILPLGSPRCDYLIRNKENKEIPESLKRVLKPGKKRILYAPTFRDDAQSDSALLGGTDFEYLKNELGDEYEILIKLHPRIHSSGIPEGVTDVTKFDINELTLVSDLLITDYSSVCMNFALLGKPCVFYAFDLEKYETDRSFYKEYRSYVPGPVVTDYRDLPQAIKNPGTAPGYEAFRDFNFDYFDDKSSERIFGRIIRASQE